MQTKGSKAAENRAEDKRRFGDLPEPLGIHAVPTVITTGSDREGSIGSAIEAYFNKMAIRTVRFVGDVRTDPLPEIRQDTIGLIVGHAVSHMNWFIDADAAASREVFDATAYGTWKIIQDFVRATIDLPHRKKIVVIGSMAYRVVLNGSSAYCAAKAAQAQLVRCLAWELAPKGFDVFIVHPSNVDGSPMAEDTIQGLMRYQNLTREEAEGYWGDSYLRGRSLTKGEIASVVFDCFKPEKVFLSGSQIELAGGQR